MKMTKRFFALLLSVLMVLALGVNAFAAVKNGLIVIENSSTEREYTVYRIFNASTDGNGNTAYTLSTKTDWEVNDFFTADSRGNVVATESATDAKTGELTPAAVAWLSEQVKGGKKYIKSVAKETGNGKDLEIRVPYGYYFITTGQGSAVTIDSANPNALVFDKNNEAPGPELESPTDPGETPTEIPYKTVMVGSSTEKVSEGTVDAGEKLTFTVTFRATNYETKKNAETEKVESKQILKYVILDTANNISIDWDTAVVKVGGKVLTKNVDYKILETESNINILGQTASGSIKRKFIVIKWANPVGQSEETYTNIYNSPSTVEITYSGKMGVGESTNDVDIYYELLGSEEYSKVPKPDPDPEVKLSNHKVTVESYKKTEAAGKLEGTSYVLYDADNGKYYKYDSVNKVVSWVNSETEATVLNTVSATGEFVGLEDGNYKVKEMGVPAGYNVAATDEEATIEGNDVTVKFFHGAGLELPATGGVGTTMFYVFGGMLLIGAAVLLVVRRRMAFDK